MFVHIDKNNINVTFIVISDIKENKNLHELLYLVLLAGNYLNAVSTGSVLGQCKKLNKYLEFFSFSLTLLHSEWPKHSRVFGHSKFKRVNKNASYLKNSGKCFISEIYWISQKLKIVSSKSRIKWVVQ